MGQLIIGEDSYMPLDQTTDVSKPHKPVLKHVPKQGCKLARLLHFYDLIDTGTDLHPTSRDYTHYSKVHKTYSRTDHLFTPSQTLPLIKSAKILTAAWSDHSPVQISLSDLGTKPKPSVWRLNAALFNGSIDFSEIEMSIRQYFIENRATDTSPSINWAAHKATICGKLIQLASRAKRMHTQTIQQEKALQAISDEQKDNPKVTSEAQN